MNDMMVDIVVVVVVVSKIVIMMPCAALIKADW